MRKTIVLQRDTRQGSIPLPYGGFRCKTAGVCRIVLPGNASMERVTLRIPKQQVEEVEQMVDTGEFPNRSEAIRSAVREMLNEYDDTDEESQGRGHNWAKV